MDKKSFNLIESKPINLEKTNKVWGKDLIKKLWSLNIGAKDNVARIDISGLWLGNKAFKDAPFSVDMEGNVIARSISISGGSVVNVDISDYLPLDGGEMTGTLVLAGDPINNKDAATKKYVDDAVGGVPVDDYLPLDGGTMEGDIDMDGNDIETDTTTGTKIATSTTQKIAFYGNSPIVQPSTVDEAETQDLTGTDTIDQTKLETDLTSCKDAINGIISRLQDLGLIA